MELLKILIADDEQSARELIVHYLRESANSLKIFQAGDGKTTLDVLSKESPDILFLDIKMPELNGIEVLQQRESSPLPAIIFTTAFDEFALPAFDYEATDYLLKPFEKERFDRALEKATRYVQLIKNQGNKSWLNQISIKKGIKTIFIRVEEIQYFQSEGAYVKIFSGENSWLSTMPLYELESSLDPKKFLRIHKSVIVQNVFIKEIQSLPNGDFIVCLKSGKELRGSRTYKARLKERFLN